MTEALFLYTAHVLYMAKTNTKHPNVTCSFLYCWRHLANTFEWSDNIRSKIWYPRCDFFFCSYTAECLSCRLYRSHPIAGLLSKGGLAPEPSLKQPQRRTHGLPNIHLIVVHTCTRRLLNSIQLTTYCRLRPCRTKSLYLSCYSLLPLALPELPDRQANGLTDLAIFILRYTADPVLHRSIRNRLRLLPQTVLRHNLTDPHQIWCGYTLIVTD